MCILFGCDYFHGLYKLENYEIYNKIKEKENISIILKNYNLENYEKNLEKFNVAYQLYTSPYIYTKDIKFSNNKYNFKKIIKEIYNLDKELIMSKYNIYNKLKNISI